MDQGRTEQADSHSDEWLTETEALKLFAIDHPLHDSRAAAAEFLGPVDCDPAAFVEFLMPANAGLPVAFAFVGHDIAWRWRELLVRFEPGTHFDAKRFIFGAVSKV